MSKQDGIYDLLVVGGGINGVGIARDAVGRGLSVLLVEQSDLASGTSSASSKLIHGGLRYLEQYEFRLVREALAEREVLLAIAPHIVTPLTFVLPHDASLRPAWMIRAGLFLYDHLAPRSRLPASGALDLQRTPAGEPLKPGFTRGFAYADCWVDDSRLVVLNAVDAAERGAVVRTRCRFVSAVPEGGYWRATIAPASGAVETVAARILVNAAGPWVEQVLRRGIGRAGPSKLRLVKGSHIVVPRLYAGEQAYILQNPDRRIVFVIPYEQRFTLIGTTDEFFGGDPGEVAISTAEAQYLCASASRFLKAAVRPDDVVWSYAGVRPLYDDAAEDASTLTRDYVFDVAAEEGRPPVLSIFGGKITTYRRLAEHALRQLQPHLPGLGRPWTGGRAAARRRSRRGRSRRLPGRTRFAAALASRRARAAPGRRLRHARRAAARRRGQPRRSRPRPRGGADGAGGRLSRAGGVGANRRRHPLAPQQARPAWRGEA